MSKYNPIIIRYPQNLSRLRQLQRVTAINELSHRGPWIKPHRCNEHNCLEWYLKLLLLSETGISYRRFLRELQSRSASVQDPREDQKDEVINVLRIEFVNDHIVVLLRLMITHRNLEIRIERVI